jgi:hypothetical protein
MDTIRKTNTQPVIDAIRYFDSSCNERAVVASSDESGQSQAFNN